MTPPPTPNTAENLQVASLQASSLQSSSLQISKRAPAGLDGTSGRAACQHCGGSGMLRLGGQRYRTCLECLGQGQLQRPPLGTLYVPRISVAVAVSGAR
jgi:hypothetical protein